ncbi:MAG: ribosome silencing factor [Atopobiaceae bacterium]|jgi:ribosome-associated protein
MSVTPRELAQVAVIAADDKKAEDIVLLDLTKLSDMCDYFLIMSAPNAHLADAVMDEIKERVWNNLKIKPLSCEGKMGSHWILMDYGSVVVHIFDPETRDYYRLERLWGEAPHVKLDVEGARVEPEA